MGCVGEYIGKGRHSMAHTFGWDDAQQASQATQNKITQLQLAQQQAQMNMASALQSSYHSTVSGGGYTTAPPSKRSLAEFNLELAPNTTFEDLNDEGSTYNMPLQTAIDLAINKFGSSWFKDEDTCDAIEENTKFWLEVMAKLFKAGHLIHERYSRSDTMDAGIAWKIKDLDHGNS